MIKINRHNTITTLVLIGLCSGGVASNPKPVCPVLLSRGNGHALLAGGTADGKWLSSSKIGPLITGAEAYRLYSNTRALGQAKAGKPALENENYFLTLKGADKATAVAISGSWNALPRRFRLGDTKHSAYVKAIKDFLVRKGLKNAPAVVKSVHVVDLEGDGADEVIVTGQSRDWSPWAYKKGQYSVALLLKGSPAKRMSYVLEQYTAAKSQADDFPIRYSFGGTWDLDGDGKLEIVLDWQCERADSSGVALEHSTGAGFKQLTWLAVGH